MKVISNRSTKFYKYGFPIIWFGFLCVIVVMGLMTGARHQSPMLLIMPLVMAAIGFMMFKKMFWVLADEVQDGGDYLVVRRGGEEATVYLKHIMNVSATTNMNPPQVTLRLAHPCRLGDELVFSPATGFFSLNPFRKNEIVEDLIVRVDTARRLRP